MDYLAAITVAEVLGTVFYTFLGVALLGLCWVAITKVAPFHVVKEIEQDQNVALAVLIASLFVSMSIIIAAVILS